MDRGFYSEEHQRLVSNHLKFLIGVRKCRWNMYKTELADARTQIRNWENFHRTTTFTPDVYDHLEVFAEHVPIKVTCWRRSAAPYLHLYFQYKREKETEDSTKFNRLLVKLKEEELEGGETWSIARETICQSTLKLKSTPKRGGQPFTQTGKPVMQQWRTMDTALLSNDIRDPIEALETYRNRISLKRHWQLKGNGGHRRMEVSSELSLDGKLFVEFIALIYLSYIKDNAG